MQVVAEYRKRAQDWHEVAERTSNSVDKKRLKYRAEAWAMMAALRERNLTDKNARVPPAQFDYNQTG